MTTLEFTLLVWLGSLVAGFLGSLTGLGGSMGPDLEMIV